MENWNSRYIEGFDQFIGAIQNESPEPTEKEFEAANQAICDLEEDEEMLKAVSMYFKGSITANDLDATRERRFLVLEEAILTRWMGGDE